MVEDPVNLLVNSRWDVARGAGVVKPTDQAGTLVHAAITCITVIDNLLQRSDVPARNLEQLALMTKFEDEVCLRNQRGDYSQWGLH